MYYSVLEDGGKLITRIKENNFALKGIFAKTCKKTHKS